MFSAPWDLLITSRVFTIPMHWSVTYFDSSHIHKVRVPRTLARISIRDHAEA